MRIVSWNLGAAFGPYVGSHDRAWEWLAALEPDVAFLQETVPPDWAKERWAVVALPFTHWASTIVPKPGLDVRAIALEPGSLLARFGSYLATAEVRLADGSLLLLASVHARAAEAPDWITDGHDRAMIARSSVGVPWSNDVAFEGYRALAIGRRFIIAGDWNTARYVDDAGQPSPDGLEFFARAESEGWVEVSLDSRGNEGRSWYGPGGPRPYQPDHVFVDPVTASTVRSVTIDPYPVTTLALSDHAPLVVEFDLACRVATELDGLLEIASGDAR